MSIFRGYGIAWMAVIFFSAPAEAQPLRISRGYLTPKDITDPAAFSFQRDTSWHTKLDGALILGTSAKGIGLPSVTVEGGYYASVGSVREQKARVHGTWGGVTTDVGPLLTDAKLAWETTTDSKTRAYTGTVRFSPLTWREGGIGFSKLLAKVTGGTIGPAPRPAGYGSFVDFSWRPYVGFQYGRLQRAAAPIEVAEGEPFRRMMFNGDALLRVVQVRRIPVNTDGDSSEFVNHLELSAKANMWRLLEDGEWRTQYVLGVAFPFNKEVKIKIDWEEARKPPAFRYEQSISLGIGVVR